MLIKQVIINYSPLIALFKSQQAHLLPQLFTDILKRGGVKRSPLKLLGTLSNLIMYLSLAVIYIFSWPDTCVTRA